MKRTVRNRAQQKKKCGFKALNSSDRGAMKLESTADGDLDAFPAAVTAELGLYLMR